MFDSCRGQISILLQFTGTGSGQFFIVDTCLSVSNSVASVTVQPFTETINIQYLDEPCLLCRHRVTGRNLLSHKFSIASSCGFVDDL